MTTTSLYVSSGGASARLSELEVIANNLANADTPGFRADEPTFATALEAALVDVRGRALPGTRVHSFVDTGVAATRHLSGPVHRTGGALDVAIDGPGFFELETPEGRRFTRAGNFQVDASGALVTPAGHAVIGAGGPLQVSNGPAHFTADGGLIDRDGNPLGRLAVQVFDDPDVLRKEGGNLYSAPESAEPEPATALRVMPGSIEGSNVEPAMELARLVVLQRAYDASMQALEADDSAARRLIQEITR